MFKALQKDETEDSPDNTYKSFVFSCENAAKESVTVKKNIKKRVPWESQKVIKKRKRLHRIAEIKNSERTAMNIRNLNSTRGNLRATYESEQKMNIQDKNNKITIETTKQNSSQAWKAVNEISVRKTTKKDKIKAKIETDKLKI